MMGIMNLAIVGGLHQKNKITIKDQEKQESDINIIGLLKE